MKTGKVYIDAIEGKLYVCRNARKMSSTVAYYPDYKNRPTLLVPIENYGDFIEVDDVKLIKMLYGVE